MSTKVGIEIESKASGSGVKATVDGLKMVHEAAHKATEELHHMAAEVVGTITSLLGLHGIVETVKEAVEVGMEFRQAMSGAQLGIAAMLHNLHPEKFKEFSDAMETAQQAIEQLKEEFEKHPTKAGFLSLLQDFRELTGTATSAGLSIQEQIKLFPMLAAAMQGVGLPAESLVREAKAMFTGNITERSLLSGNLGINKEDVERAMVAGRLYEYLSKKLEAYSDAADVASERMGVGIIKLKEAFEETFGELVGPLMESINRGVRSLAEAVASPEFREGLEPFAHLLQKGADLVLWMGTAGARHIKAVISAVELLGIAMLTVAGQATISAFNLLWSKLVAGATAFQAASLAVAQASSLGGAAIASLTTVVGALSVAVAAISGWKLGETIGELELFGAKINDVVTYNILRAMLAWEKLKKSFGFGDASYLAGVEKSIQDLLVPPKAEAKKPEHHVEDLPGGGASDKLLKQRYEQGRAFMDIEAEQNALLADELKVRGLLRTEATPEGVLFARRVGTLNQEADALRRVLRASAQLVEEREKARRDAEASDVITPEESAKEEVKNARELLRIRQELLAIQEKTGDFSFFEKLSRNLQDMEDKFAHFGSQVADILTNGIGRAVDTVADGMWQVIDGTATWGDLFRQVARQAISDLVKVAIQEVVLANLKKGLLATWKAIQSAFRTADVAEANATEAAKTPALATNATLASISSWGVAVAIGLAAIAAVLAGVGAFEKGGVVEGGKQTIVVNERGQEAVLNARATAMLGAQRIAALNAGIATNLAAPESVPVAAPGATQQQPVQVSILLVDSRNSSAAKDFIESSQGRVVVAEVVRQARLEIGFKS